MEQTGPAATPRFEDALARLEAIAALLDRNDLPLAEALQLCAEAAVLRRQCRAQLSEAEGTVQQLIELANGDDSLEPLAG